MQENVFAVLEVKVYQKVFVDDKGNQQVYLSYELPFEELDEVIKFTPKEKYDKRMINHYFKAKGLINNDSK